MKLRRGSTDQQLIHLVSGVERKDVRDEPSLCTAGSGVDSVEVFVIDINAVELVQTIVSAISSNIKQWKELTPYCLTNAAIVFAVLVGSAPSLVGASVDPNAETMIDIPAA